MPLSHLPSAWAPLRPRFCFALLILGCAGFASTAAAQDSKVTFDVPAGDASQTLKQFAQQAGRQILYHAEAVRGVTTAAVKGDYSALEAINLMLAGTDLHAVQDEQTGTLAVNRTPASPPTAADPPPGQTVPPVPAPSGFAPPAAGSETVTLTPFEVQADSDKSYGALNSNSITAFNTALDRLPISADIFDQAFMNDTMSSNVEQLLQTYSAGAGYSTSSPGSSAATLQPLDRNGTSYIQLRGLAAPSQMRDNYMILGTMDNPGSTGVGYSNTWDLERVEVINGPQALLYGFGGGGGVINMVSKQARLGKPAFGSLMFQVDQYGNKEGLLDYGMGNENFAIRLTVVDANIGGRRVDVGGPLNGDYLQIAFKLFQNTVVRIQGEESTFNRITSNEISLNAGSTSADARNGQQLHYLLATNQLGSAAPGGASGAGVIGNGYVNWDNVDSYQGWWGGDLSVIDFYELNADSEWNSWLSTQIGIGYSYSDEDRVNDTFSFYSPNASANIYPGNWTMAMTGSGPAGDQYKPSFNKVFRGSALVTNDLFGGRAHSQTNIGGNFFRSDTGETAYEYYLADSNFNVVINPSITANGGRTVLPTVGWTVNNGPVAYPLWAPRAQRITYNGANYVRQQINPVSPSLISPFDPLGIITQGGGNTTVDHVFDKGLFLVNYTQWLDGKLDTILGFRVTDSRYEKYYEGASTQGPDYLAELSRTGSFNVGVDYKLLSWLRPYLSASDSYEPALDPATDPDGVSSLSARSIGEEAGFKAINASGTISGSVAIYHAKSANEETQITSSLLNDINPSGLNGRFGNPSVWLNVARDSEGVQAQFTATPTPNWRLRFSAAVIDGTIGTTTSYAQLYNDNFHENSAGQVTYADGTVVFVNPTFNSKQLTVPSSTAGAIPLTVAAMSSSSNAYYANPVAISGQINSGSNAAKVLAVVDPVHGAILTGLTGLPISQIQINPGFTPIGVIPTSTAGQVTTNYPEYSFNFTSVYEFSSGWAKGFKAGGSIQVAWNNRDYYYYPTGPTPGAVATLFSTPTNTNCNLILGYTHKLKRITWSTQLNVNNIFNHYEVIIVPNSISGYAGPNDATFTNQPRGYLWTNTLSF